MTSLLLGNGGCINPPLLDSVVKGALTLILEFKFREGAVKGPFLSAKARRLGLFRR